ncbi:MAG: putative C-S lyase [Bacteroidetes bacterium]|jgi:cysteine-S-conjugate beta-lyase|nr:putative C-S lyase [Bacteroidota bacterium]MBT3748544.1 putative C-S lyase [Bacteroidota bacterium]MBT4398983.1 putative C-S lyase [Bacteroidota bacterium]MBT4411253.1 putative C-S lyase [Bacteroidota bacterium]MBT5425067.1 putative C-S lyase [Bacteroidota bacterium]
MSKTKTYDFDKLVARENTNCVKWDLRETFFGKADILPLWVADMDFETPDFIIEKIKDRMEHPVLGYTIRPDSFNEAFIQWAKQKYQWDVDKEWMNFSPGVVSAVTLAVMACTLPGDEVIVQPPVYFPFFRCVKGLNRVLKHNPLREKDGRLCMDLEHLEEIITPKTKMLILCNPHNPGGSAWNENELKALGDICEKHQILVLSDEIHSDLVFEPHKHIPFAKAVPSGRVKSITCMAASKSFNLAGMSTSLVIIPDKQTFKLYNEMLQTVHINMGNILGSIATETAYAEGWNWLHQLMDYLTANRDYLSNFVKIRLDSVRMLMPEATYLAWLDLSKTGLSEEDLNKLMVEKAGVALNSGTMFGQGGEGFMRINFACPRSILTEALEKIEKALNTV